MVHGGQPVHFHALTSTCGLTVAGVHDLQMTTVSYPLIKCIDSWIAPEEKVITAMRWHVSPFKRMPPPHTHHDWYCQ